MAVVALLMGLGIMLNWKKTDLNKIKKWQFIPLALAVFLGSLLPGIISDSYSISAAITIFLGSWVIFASISDVVRKTQNAKSFWVGFRRLTLSYKGMAIAHIGFAFTLLGAGINTIYSDQKDIRLAVGDTYESAGYQYELNDVSNVRGPNYSSNIAEIRVIRNEKVLSILTPEKRKYFSGGNEMTEASVDVGVLRDLYVALGESLGGTEWAVRIHYKPLVRWIWFGAFLMGLGGIVAIIDKRYQGRRRKVAPASSSETVKGEDIKEPVLASS